MADTMKLSQIALIAAVLAVLPLFAWQRNHYITLGESRVQSQWNAQKLEDTKAALQEEIDRRQEEDRQRRNTERITHENQQLQNALVLRNRAAVDREHGLLDDIAERDIQLAEIERTSADAIAAATAREARTAAQLLGRCTGRYRAVAAAADELAIQVTGLQDYAKQVCQPANTQQGQQ